MSVKVVLSFGAVVLHKTQCLIFLIRGLHLITTLSHHHITTSSHYHITTSSHYHITTSSHYHIIPHQFPPRFFSNEFRQLCSLKNIMRIKKSLLVKKISALPSTSPMFLSALKNTIISPILRELCDRNTRISYLIPHQFPHRFIANEFRQLCSLKNIMRIKKSLRIKRLRIHN